MFQASGIQREEDTGLFPGPCSLCGRGLEWFTAHAHMLVELCSEQWRISVVLERRRKESQVEETFAKTVKCEWTYDTWLNKNRVDRTTKNGLSAPCIVYVKDTQIYHSILSAPFNFLCNTSQIHRHMPLFIVCPSYQIVDGGLQGLPGTFQALLG